MKKEIYFKGSIAEINTSCNTSFKDEIIYRIINFDDIYYFAEEIATGCLFPGYSFSKVEDSKNSYMKFRHSSYLRCGKYFLFVPLVSSESIFKYSLSEKNMKSNDVSSPSMWEVKKYLKEKQNDETFMSKIRKMEAENEFFCDINLIKQKVALLKDENLLNIDFSKTNPFYETYNPSISVEEISDFGFDMSEDEELCSLIGREEEKKKIIKSICINGDSVLLIGKTDSGKTALVESLAKDIKNESNEWLKGKIIFYLETSNLEANTKFKGTFEDKIKKIIDFCLKNREKIILFIDGIHSLYGLGRTESRAMDAMNILKPYVSNGKIVIIGTTTPEEYREYMTKDQAFLKRFEIIDVSLPNKEMTIDIMLSFIEKLEKEHNIILELPEQEKYQFVEYITNLTEPENEVMSNVEITTIKRIFKDAFAEAIYNKKNKVTYEEIYLALLSCNKFSLEFRKNKLEELKFIIEKLRTKEELPLALTKTKK